MLRAVGVSWMNLHRVAYQNHAVNRYANEEIDQFVYEFATRGRKRRRCVIGGDINDLASSPEIQKLKARSNLLIRTRGGIDYLLYKGWVIITKIFKHEDDGGSDHYPRVFRFKTYKWVLRRG